MTKLASFRKQQFLYLRPDLPGQSSLRPAFRGGDVWRPADFMLSYGWLNQFGFVLHFRFGFVLQNGFIEQVGGFVSLQFL